MANETCPSREQIAAYLSSVLDVDASERLAAHVEVCEDCQATLQTLCEFDNTLLEQLRSPVEDSPFVGESECERAVEHAAAEAFRSGNAEGVPNQRDEWPVVLTQLSEYEVLGFIKEGGMGSVYRARQTHLGRTVAIKLMLPRQTSDPKARARFEREIQLVGKLRHPHIVQAYDAREIDGTLLLVMEFLEGLSLGDILRNLGALPIADACELTRQAALGLSHAHSQGLVHRDVKPSNFMLDEYGQVKVLDLGLARIHTDESASGETTSSGQLMGTADYMAPEQIKDAHEVDARADIYSLGCTLYALLTGVAPFESLGRHGGHAAKMMAHLEKEPTPIRERRADVPPRLAAVLQRMMAKSLENRLATAAEVAEAMRPFCVGADLPALLDRARAAKAALPPHPSEPAAVPRNGDGVSAQTAAHNWRRAGVVLTATATLFLLVALGIVIRIRYKDGREKVITVPDGAQLVIETDVPATGATTPQPDVDGAVAAAKPGEIPVAGTVSLVARPGDPLSPRALTMQPPPLPGVQSWTLESPAHRGEINTVAYSPDGQVLATGGDDSTVRVWDAASTKLLRVLHGHGGIVWQVAWSHDGKRLASASDDGTVRVWDAATGRIVHVLMGHEGAVRAVAWSPDDLQIASGGADKSLRFRDARTGRSNAMMPVSSAVVALDWLPDGKSLVMADDQKTVQIVEAETKTAVRTLTHDEVVSDMAVTADGLRLASADTAGTVYLWDITAGARLLAESKLSVAGENAAERHPSWVSFSPDGKHLAAGGACRSVRVWEVSSGLPAYELAGHADGIRHLAWSPEGKTVVTVCDAADAAMRFWDINTGNVRANVDGYRPIHLSTIGWSPDGRTFAFRQGDGSEWFLDTTLGQPVVRAFERPTIDAWSTGGECVVRGSSLGDLALRRSDGPAFRALRWDVIQKSIPLEPGEEPVSMIAEWSGNFKLLAVPYSMGGTVDRVRIVSLESGDVLHVLKTGNVGRMSLSRDGSTLVTNPYDFKEPRLLVWDTRSGQLRRTITGAELSVDGFWAIGLNADGTKLAAQFPWGALVCDLTSSAPPKWANHNHSAGQPESSFRWLPDNRRFLVPVYANGPTNADYWVFDTEMGNKVDLALPAFMGFKSVHKPDALILPGVPSQDSRFVAGTVGMHVIPVWETASGRVHMSLLAYQRADRPIHFAMDAAGNYVWLTPDQDNLLIDVATDQGQEVVTPEEFSRRFGWKNDQAKVRLEVEGVAPDTAINGQPAPTNPGNGTAQIQAEPVALQSGERISATALTIQPEPIPAVQAWTVDTPTHRGLINSVSFSPDGETVATGGEDGTVRLWSSDSMQLLRILYGHNHVVWKVTWSRDGARLASASEDGTLRLWEAASGRVLKVLKVAPDAARNMSWSPDDSLLATFGTDRKIRLADGNSNQPLDVIPLGATAVACAWSADGQTLAVAHEQRGIELVDVKSHGTRRILTLEENASELQFAADGLRLAAVDLAGTVYLWDIGTGDRLFAETRMSVAGEDPSARQPACVAFSPDGSRVAAGGVCRAVRIWDTGTAKMLCELKGHADSIRAVAWSPDGKMVVSAAGPSDLGMRMSDSATGQLTTTVESYRWPSVSYSSAWSPDGQVLITSPTGQMWHANGPVQFWDMNMSAPTERFESAGQPVRCLWSPNGELLLIDAPEAIPASFLGRPYRRLSLINVANAAAEPGENADWKTASFSPDGALAAIAYDKNYHIRVFSLASQELRATLKGHTNLVCCLALHPDGKRLLSSSYLDFTMRLWDVTTSEQTEVIDTRFPGNEGAGFVAWLPDGSRYVYNSPWCIAGLESLLGYSAPTFLGNPVAFSANGEKVVGTETFFDRQTAKGTPVVAPYFRTLNERGWSIPSFSPDNRYVCIPDSPNVNVIWDAEKATVRAALMTFQRGDQYVCLSTNPAGHHAWLSPGDDPLVYVVLTDAGQEVLSSAAFASRFGWKNDPATIRVESVR